MVYFVIEDKFEYPENSLFLPTFAGKIAKLEKRYLNLQVCFFSANQALKNIDLSIFSFFARFRFGLESFVVEPILMHQLYTQSLEQIAEFIVVRNPVDEKFLKCFCKTQIFSMYVDSLKKMLLASGGSFEEHIRLV